jgi:hypothetical protein
VSATNTRQQPHDVTFSASRPRLLVDELTLTALPSAIQIGALFAKYSARRWGLPLTVAKMAECVAAELVTRAVKTTGNPDPRPRWCQLGELQIIGIRVSRKAQGLLVEVWDSDPTPPQDLDSHLSAVSEISEQWNCYRPNGGGGKVIWAQLTFRQPQPSVSLS